MNVLHQNILLEVLPARKNSAEGPDVYGRGSTNLPVAAKFQGKPNTVFQTAREFTTFIQNLAPAGGSFPLYHVVNTAN
jgi:hypothetical protein